MERMDLLIPSLLTKKNEMTDAKILIVEDEILIAEDLKDLLNSLGFQNIAMVHDKQSALQAFETFRPQIALLDVHLENEADGIVIGQHLSENKTCQFIYVTAHSDVEMVKKIIQTNPAGYITKPVKKSDLFASVSIALGKTNANKNVVSKIQIKDGYDIVLIDAQTIRYIEAEGNYLNIFCDDKKYVVRQSLDAFLEEAKNDILYRIHRSYAVNIQKVVRYSKKEIFLKDMALPVSRNIKDEFDNLMKSKI